MIESTDPRRGWLYLAELSPAFGTEPGKVRPVLVLQTDLLNRAHSSTVVLPLTSVVAPQSALLRVHLERGEGGLKTASDIMIDQTRAIDNRRLRKRLGSLSPERLLEVEEKIAKLLDLN